MRLDDSYENYSLSCGTMKPRQILENIADFLDNCLVDLDYAEVKRTKKLTAAVRLASALLDAVEVGVEVPGSLNGEIEDFAVNVLNEDVNDFLNEIAPNGYYFGAHPGDGSDFGFWPVEEGMDDE